MDHESKKRKVNGDNHQSLEFGKWVVHKFGGTSLAIADCYRNSANIVLGMAAPPAGTRNCVVVSAMGEIKPGSNIFKSLEKLLGGLAKPQQKTLRKSEKVTSLLIKCHEMAAGRDEGYQAVLQDLKAKHYEVVDELLSASASRDNKALIDDLKAKLDKDFEDLSFVLRANWLSKHADENHWSYGYGELWSARLMCAFINSLRTPGTPERAVFLDAREVIFLLRDVANTPDFSLSQHKLSKWMSEKIPDTADIIVCTGYIASDADGKPTTLGRDGSDYSASIMGALLSATSVTIWTDVDGVYSANPAIVPTAAIRDNLTYDEASELAHFGAKVIHPKTMTPVVIHDIPIWLRNSFNPTHPGTCIKSKAKIYSEPGKVQPYGVQGFSCIDNLTLISVEGTGMIGVPGIASRLFTALKFAGSSVVLISQAGSEHSICFAVPFDQGDVGVNAVRREFRDELEFGHIETVERSARCACLAVVGEGMKELAGVAGRLFSALGSARINIMAIAQGSSERNISVIIDQNDAKNGLAAVHRAFVEEPSSPIMSRRMPPAVAGLNLDGGDEDRKKALRLQISTLQKELDSLS